MKMMPTFCVAPLYFINEIKWKVEDKIPGRLSVCVDLLCICLLDRNPRQIGLFGSCYLKLF